jgi:hypothetical protein
MHGRLLEFSLLAQEKGRTEVLRYTRNPAGASVVAQDRL